MSQLFIPDRGTLEGQRQKKDIKAVLDDPLLQFSGQYCSEYSDMYVQCGVYANGKPLCLPVRTILTKLSLNAGTGMSGLKYLYVSRICHVTLY